MTNHIPPQSHIAILLCTHNGQEFLDQQLDSIARQTHRNWRLWASDDASADATKAILDTFQSAHGPDRVSILQGPGAGSSANFLSLACNDRIHADYFAYADQDDVWLEDKLSRAVAWLAAQPVTTPALYCSRTQLIDHAGQDLGISRLFTKPPSFRNALVQNIGGGNTMVFNRAACDVLRAAGPHVEVVVHDWWTYMTVTGCGGEVFNDPQPTLKYRQHGANQIGSNLGLSARIIRASQLLEGRFRGWTDINLRALTAIQARLTPENRSVLQAFAEARAKPLIPRLIGLARSGITRQTFTDNVGLYLAAALNRL
jgi:glycosyltransferase involved in cell wall biosynthesis